jgi:hypothetical protein
MAEDFRTTDPAVRVVSDARVAEMIAECKRQEESCHYTSTMLFEWLKALRRWRISFVVLPIVFSAIATSSLLADEKKYAILTGVLALAAGVIPAIYKALDLDVSLEQIAKCAHEYKVLQDRFRVAWRVTALGLEGDFRDEFNALRDRMDSTRSTSLTPPERYFKAAQTKIQSGDYAFTHDMAAAPPAAITPSQSPAQRG